MSHSSTLMKKIRYGYAFGHNKNGKRDASSCASGGFYTAPTLSQTVSAADPFNISWDPSCLDTKAADIYLYAPNAPNPRIHLWQNVNFQLGSYQTALSGAWWNSTASATLQLAIVPHGLPPFMATLPAGPLFTATYTPSASGDAAVGASVGAVQNVNNFDDTKHLSKGKIAAAVIMPLLVVAAIFAGLYIWKQRKQVKQDRKKWGENVDKRMSTISADWKSITPAGATAAVRQSMAPGDRASSFSYGAIRPISTVALEGGQAGIGARGIQAGGIDVTTPQMSQLRPGLRDPSTITGERVSRVSFAPDTRPSGESRRSLHNPRTSRFQTSIVPPLPERQDSAETMSPTQTSGPLTLTADDIKARMTGQDNKPRPSVDEVMPALSMMRTGDHLAGNDEMLFTPPSPPAPTYQSAPQTSIVGMMPMQPMPANMMSPDDMLRAYAEQRRAVASPPPVNGPAVPSPVANYNGNGMRVLYSPIASDSATLAMSPKSSARKSLAPTIASKYDDDDAYGGTA